MWGIFFCLSAALLALSAAGAVYLVRRGGGGRLLTPFNLLFAGVFAASLAALVPIYAIEEGITFRSLLIALHAAFQIFTIDADTSVLVSYEGMGALAGVYPGYLAVLYVCGPLFTFGFLLSFIKDLSTGVRFALLGGREMYVFSHLNEASAALAGDIGRHHPRAAIVFTGADGVEDGALLDAARSMGGVCFKRGLMELKLKSHSRTKPASFFIMGPEGEENCDLALGFIGRCSELERSGRYGFEKSRLYVFASGEESALLFSKRFDCSIKIRRVDRARSLIYNNLYAPDRRTELFDSAGGPGPDGRRLIHVLIAGLGDLGEGMLRALAWFCQMEGYRVEIDAFDLDPMSGERLMARCPELLSPRFNGVRVPGEAEYTIRLHPGVDVRSWEFEKTVMGLRDVTYVFTALGSDGENLRTAARLRTLFVRNGSHPVIKAVIYGQDRLEALGGIGEYTGESWNIGFIGDISESCSEAAVISSTLENAALRMHLEWSSHKGDRERAEEEFWRNEYFYSSSVSSAIHKAAAAALGIPGAGKREEDMTEDERRLNAAIEHRRWNAYMRSEGYVYSPQRSGIGRTHDKLVNFDDLTPSDKSLDLAQYSEDQPTHAG